MTKFITKSIEKKELLPITFKVFWNIAYGSLYSLLELHRENKSMSEKPFKFSQEIRNKTFNLIIKTLTP